MAQSEIEILRERMAALPRPTNLDERRAGVEALGTSYVISKEVRTSQIQVNGFRAEWTETSGANAAGVLLFLHGGGYITGSIASHRHLAVALGRAARLRTFSLDYRLAPEHPFPAAVDDVVTAYKFLLDSEGIDPRTIALAGDSAGGGLALAALVSLRDRSIPLPSCVWCGSPWADLSNEGLCETEKATCDPMATRADLEEMAEAYLDGRDPRSALASPLHADLRGLPPLLIQVGSAEILLDDALRLSAAAASADVSVTLQIWPRMLHGWYLLFPELAEGRRAIDAFGAFVAEAQKPTA